MTTKEKAAYLRGLAEGYGLLGEDKSGRVLSAVLDILSELACDVEDLEDTVFDLAEEVDQLGESMDAMEDAFLDESDSEEEPVGCRHGCCANWEDDEGDEDEDGDEDPATFYEVTCAACGETITIDEDVLALGSIPCPKCGADMDFDFGFSGTEDSEEEGGDE